MQIHKPVEQILVFHKHLPLEDLLHFVLNENFNRLQQIITLN